MLSKSAIIHYDVIDSTNLESKRLIDKEKIFSPTWIIASKQTAGRGRGDKKWVSQEGNLLASLILPIDFSLDRLPFLSCIVALSLHQCISKVITDNKPLKIKWPNDILYDDAKLAGVLIENSLSQSKNFSIIGIGINVAHHPIIERKNTTSLNAIMQKNMKTMDLIKSLEIILNEYLEKSINNSEALLIDEYKSKCWNYNKTVKFMTNDKVLEGILIDISKDFEIIINANNKNIKLNAGELSFDY